MPDTRKGRWVESGLCSAVAESRAPARCNSVQTWGLVLSSHQAFVAVCSNLESLSYVNPLHHFRRHRTASMPTHYWTRLLATTPRRQPASPHWLAPTCGPATSCLRWSRRSKHWAPLLCTLGCCWPATATSTAPPRPATCRGCTTSWLPRAATRVGGVGWLGGG